MIKHLILLVSAKESDCYKISPLYLIRILYCVSNFLIDFFDDTRLDILCASLSLENEGSTLRRQLERMIPFIRRSRVGNWLNKKERKKEKRRRKNRSKNWLHAENAR